MNGFQSAIANLKLNLKPDRQTHWGIGFYSSGYIIEALDIERITVRPTSQDDWDYNRMIFEAAAEELDAVIYEYPRGEFDLQDAIRLALSHSCSNVILVDLS
jgi:hypothetical protein